MKNMKWIKNMVLSPGPLPAFAAADNLCQRHSNTTIGIVKLTIEQGGEQK